MRTIKLSTEKTSSLTVTLPRSAFDKITNASKNLTEHLGCDISKNTLTKELILDAIDNATIDIDGNQYNLDQIINKEYLQEPLLQHEKVEAIDMHIANTESDEKIKAIDVPMANTESQETI